MPGLIKCEICGKQFITITATHLKTHNITLDIYKQQFPDTVVEVPGARVEHTKFAKTDLFADKLEDVFIAPTKEKEEKDKKDIFVKNEDPHTKDFFVKDLSIVYPDVEKDRYIERFSITRDMLEFRFVTDLCIPSLMLILEFPKVFWHNENTPNAMRHALLESIGWKTIIIDSASPETDEVYKLIGEFVRTNKKVSNVSVSK